MANQKEYKIIINGIKESIDGIGTLQDSLDKLGKKVEESGGHFQTASKGMDELAKTNQKIAQYNEEYQKALAANKAVLADNAKAIKSQLDLEKANLTVQANLQDTYAQKQQLLTALGKVIKNTTGDTSELRSQYAQLNQELKDFDATMGNHQRNVGDYRGALKEAQAELKSLKGQLLDVAKGSEEWEKLTKKAGDLEDKIHDINDAIKREASDTKALDNVVNIAQSATAAFTLWKGAMSMFGVETEGAVEAIQKLQGAMAVLQSLQQLQETLKGSTATAELFSKGLKALTVSMEGASTGAKALKVALMGIGIGIIIALIAELVTHWEDLTKALGFATNAQKEANEVMEAGTKAYAKAKAELDALTAKVNAFNGSKEQEKQLVDELNSKYGSAFGHYKTLAEWKDVLKKKTDAYIQSMMLEAQMQATINQLSEAYTKQSEAKKKYDDRDNISWWQRLLGDSKTDRKKEFEEANHNVAVLEEKVEGFAKQIVELNQNNELFNFSPTIEKNGKKSIDKAKEVAKKIAEEWVKAEREGLEAAQALRDETNEKQKKDAEGVAKAKDKLSKSEYERDLAILDAEKERLTIEGKYLTNEEDIRKNKDKINALEAKRLKIVRDRAVLEAKNSAASELGIDPSKIDEILDYTTGKYKNLTEEQKLVIDNLRTQVETLDIGLATALSKLFGGDGSTGNSGDTQNPLAKFLNRDEVKAFIDLTLDSIAVIGDAIADLYDMELEEMEEKLDQLAELHDEAVEKVNESQDKISDLNQKMKDSSGAQLEAYKQQMADEMLLLQQRQQEEKRVQKEKEKQEEAIKKKQKQARKDEMKVQLIESIVNTALAVTKTFSAYPMPFAAILGGIISTLGAIQQGIIIKQMSKLAEGGLLSGPSHSNGGIPVGNTGVEVEGGEYVVNKRSTAKYLPLLQSINEEGARHKTVANQIGKMADGGQLNYERINSNLDSLSTASIVASAISGIDLHPVVSVVDINREQRNYTEVRQLAGANN